MLRGIQWPLQSRFLPSGRLAMRMRQDKPKAVPIESSKRRSAHRRSKRYRRFQGVVSWEAFGAVWLWRLPMRIGRQCWQAQQVHGRAPVAQSGIGASLRRRKKKKEDIAEQVADPSLKLLESQLRVWQKFPNEWQVFAYRFPTCTRRKACQTGWTFCRVSTL